jgi:hypothetical protein
MKNRRRSHERRLNPGDSNPPGPFPRWKEGWLVCLLCAAAALRVFVYSAAFPFFNNVDEGSHLDMIVKYSRLPFPSGMQYYNMESVSNMMLFSSPEYLLTPDQFPDGKFPPPPWLHPSQPVPFPFAGSLAWWKAQVNHESGSGPLYYVLAGLWMRLGRCLGLANLPLLYWVRFFNIPLAAALVWLGYTAARTVFPERRLIHLAVPLLLAFFPQDCCYAIQSDTLSPLCFGAAFLGLARLFQSEAPSPLLGALTGLALAAAWLVKITNLPVVAVAFLAVILLSWNRAGTGKWRASAPSLALLLLCAALPVGGWGLWSLHAFGDPSGSSSKIHALGWIAKPFPDWWRHPLFSPSGFLTFWSELLASFWRGEFVWGRHRLAIFAVDLFYWLSSLLLPGVAVAGLLWKRSSLAAPQRRLLWLCFASFAASVAFLGLASVAFDFRHCVYPSPDHPYFTSGRLLCGALIPFFLLYARGLDLALSPLKSGAARTAALGAIVLLMALSECILSLPAFGSLYNWYHI